MSKKILIIEDEDTLASVLSAKFIKEGFDAIVAKDGEAGLNKVADWRPDLILLDIVMPKMNGYEVLENLQKNGNKIPVIIISNSGQEVELEKTKKLGAVDSIVKTQIDPEEVINKTKEVLNLSPAVGAREKENSAAAAEAGGVKILLVEDDPFLRDICYKKLRKEGFNVSVAADGEEAVKIIDKFQPKIVLLDIILPSMDGFEVLRQIRAIKNAAVKDIPVIMLTNLGQEEDIKKALDLGASDYLVKAHFTTEEIVAKVKNKLGV